MNEKFKVFLRVRKSNNTGPWLVKNGCLFKIVDENTRLEYPFFKYVFRDESGEELYNKHIKDSIMRFLCGKNCTIFAYGQTGSGKTYTMSNAENNVIELSLKTIFEQYNMEIGKFEVDLRTEDVNNPQKNNNLCNFLENKVINKSDFILKCPIIGKLDNKSMNSAILNENSSRSQLNNTIYLQDIENNYSIDFVGYPSIKISYIEIYNEQIYDLINSNKKLRIFSVDNNLIISKLTKVDVKTFNDALNILEKSEKNRSISQTKFNDRSSRSHTLFQIEYKVYDRISVLNLIDLAGSEKAADNRERRMEGAYINRSLLALGSVVENLISNSEDSIPETTKGFISNSGNCVSRNKQIVTSSGCIISNSKSNILYSRSNISNSRSNISNSRSNITNSYVNFRNSKLTRILQSSMIGDVELISLCMMNEDRSCVDESLSTLNFASRMSQIKIKTKVSKTNKTKMKRCPYCRKEVTLEDLIADDKFNLYRSTKSTNNDNNSNDINDNDINGNDSTNNNKLRIKSSEYNIGNENIDKSVQKLNIRSENISDYKSINMNFTKDGIFDEKVGYKYNTNITYESMSLEEKNLLLKRIDTLENMLTSLLAKTPSQKSTEIFLLEKNVFNLQYDLIKRKTRNAQK
ncbi:Kinesin-like protein tea2 [Dictyocoela muelleri]|nr:Kinesin-like protein tea2 [Dictyocoela muelleri]